ncbi:hypothetical protein [Actibacterium ureilyticum]|uniref:hypothetical protein n=1 Tax=Actibacterium ureilyticum TaxID=1590614 RepID=UPI000BAAD5F1|nr:hypothetical protein [Actibacterium ureilyticum]
MKHATIAYLLGAGAALAHGGHEAAVTEGAGHWLRQPDHLVVLGLAVLAAGLGVRRLLRARRARRQEA